MARSPARGAAEAASAPEAESSEERPRPRSLRGLREAVNACRACPLWANATQGVAGEGPLQAEMMLIGEQPGDQEDLAGKPFVGPAGRLLDRALDDAGIERRRVFVTNAVKHFKHEMRGKRRLHARPNAYEIEQCRWWIAQELRLVRPRLVVAMGATAASSLLRHTASLRSIRGRPMTSADGQAVVVTVHPSSLLRVPDSRQREVEYERFVEDLRAAARLAEELKTGD